MNTRRCKTERGGHCFEKRNGFADTAVLDHARCCACDFPKLDPAVVRR